MDADSDTLGLASGLAMLGIYVVSDLVELARAGVLHEISLLDLYDLAVNAIDGRDGEQVRLPRSLAGSFETAQMDQLHTCVKSTSGGLAPPPRSRCVCEVLMTSFHALR
mgnify:CR=1 FL=1|jgi:hypothetical protein